MENPLRRYRSRVINAVVVVQLWTFGFFAMNPRGEFSYWARTQIGYNDFYLYVIGLIFYGVFFCMAVLIDKLLFMGLKEDE